MVSRDKPVAVWVAVTLAEATAAPVESVSVPTILPRPWARENTGDNNRAMEISNLAFIMVLPGAEHSGSGTPRLRRPRFLLPVLHENRLSRVLAHGPRIRVFGQLLLR